MSDKTAARGRHPYWWDESAPDSRPANPPEQLPKHVDILVVGAGFSGLSAALTLARAGRQVLVVDADAVGHGCSSRNGGQIGPSFHKLGLDGLTQHYGRAKAEAILRESMQSLQWLRAFIKAESIDCDLQNNGRFKGAHSEAALREMTQECADLERITGQRFLTVSEQDQHRYIGSDFYHGGIFYPDDGVLQPAKFVSGMARRAQQAGAEIIAPARVRAISRTTAGFDVVFDRHSLSAGQVLIATNGYSGPELPFFRRRILPIRSAIIATQPLDPALVQTCFPQHNAVVDFTRLVLYYRPSPDGRRVVFGGRAFDLADRPDHYGPDLRRLMLRIFPQLDQAQISHAWSGTVAYTFDYAPHLGCHDGLHYVMGYCGSGVGRSGYFGRKIALQMLNDPQGRTEMDSLTFPTRRFYSGKPWFLPAVLRWHSLLDRFGR